MTNITKQKREHMIAFLEELKEQHSDDESIRAFNEIENHLREKKFGLVFEEHTEETDELLKENIPVLCSDKERRICVDDNLPWNFLIEGDNLQALYLLEKTHKGKIDCIYIDPPYNTGAKDWKYNNDYVDKKDLYRHSKWLSMMKTRLLFAKKLLNPQDSVLICTIDEKEYLHLGCLLEEIFPDASIQMITDVINPGGTNREKEFSRVEEYIFFCRFGKASVIKQNHNMLGNTDEINKSRVWYSFCRGNNLRHNHNRQFFPIYIDAEKKKIVEVGDFEQADMQQAEFPIREGLVSVFPINDKGEEASWRGIPSTIREWVDKGYVRVSKYDKKNKRWTLSYIPSGLQNRIESGEIVVGGTRENGALDIENIDPSLELVSPRTVWNQKYHNATDYGATILKELIPGRNFAYPKSLYSVVDSLRFFVKNKPNSIILDFFAGSGTTMHAVNLLNAEDNGFRKCICVTNNEVSATEAKTLRGKGINEGDNEWEELGIAHYVTWPRIECSIKGYDTNGNKLIGEYLVNDSLGEPILKSLGFKSNVKYFKCDWIPRKPEDYLLSNALCLHIKEMIELQNTIEIDNQKYVLILNKDDINEVILNPEKYEKVERIWLNQSIILNQEEMYLLNKKGFKYIPREFFGQELREVAE